MISHGGKRWNIITQSLREMKYELSIQWTRESHMRVSNFEHFIVQSLWEIKFEIKTTWVTISPYGQ
jgi:hypothetical protein